MLAARHEVMLEAYAAHPERFVGGPPKRVGSGTDSGLPMSRCPYLGTRNWNGMPGLVWRLAPTPVRIARRNDPADPRRSPC